MSSKRPTVGVVMDTVLRDRIKKVAEIRKWTMSQCLGAFIERYWTDWEKELGIGKAENNPSQPD